VDGSVRGLMHGSVPRETAELTTHLTQVLTDIRTRYLKNISQKGYRYRFGQVVLFFLLYIDLLFCEELQHKFYVRQIGQI